MTEPAKPLFKAEHLHKRFGRHIVLEDITLAFPAEGVSGIMGPNGAGKSTCFNVLTGMYRPTRGKIVFDGEDITGLSPRRIVAKGIARSFQIMSLFDEFTALENILVALPETREQLNRPLLDLRGVRAMSDEAADVLSRVGLKGKEHVRASDLAYGERRALEIAVALAGKPRLLFLDEPTQGLGTQGRARLGDLIGEIRRHVAVVIIEHDMPFLFRLADRISIIHWGQVIAEGSPETLRENKWVRASALGEAATC